MRVYKWQRKYSVVIELFKQEGGLLAACHVEKHAAPTCHAASALFELDCPKADTARNNAFLRLS
jgi:hypothetical protein